MNRILVVIAIAIFALTLTACKQDESDVPKEQRFTWWITKTDGMGTFYQYYEDNPGVQWINEQTWSTETGAYTSDGTGTQLEFSFQAPITGSESDNFNTMIATGSYPEIIDMAFSVDSPKDMYEEGILIEITEYVEAYMPDYLAFIDQHPEIKPFVADTDENGNTHYYGLWGFNNVPRPQWEGHAYRRDWVVKYANPTPYVWDWDSTYVTDNGHPLYTPLSEAQRQNDYTGWKTNPVTTFTSNFGDEESWEDNVIFPSGTDIPLYVSDWEWMFDAFNDAIEAEGFSGNPNAYAVSIPFLGVSETGDLVSSFGGGGPMWHIDENGDAAFGATGDNVKTYLEAMHNWYSNGWLDSRFETRSSDQFWKINLTGSSQGMVGLFQTGSAYLGTTIRATAENEDAQNDAMVWGTPLPINDVYGDASNKFKEPDTYYSSGLLNTSTGFTEKIEGKDLDTLFTMLNWFYTDEGALFSTFGLSEEKYAGMTLEPDLYAEYDIDAGYSIEERDGVTTYVANVSTELDLSNAVRNLRMGPGLVLANSEEYPIDDGYSTVVAEAKALWGMYENKGYILNYADLFDEDQSSLHSKIRTYVRDLIGVEIPALIKEGMGDYDIFISKIEKYGPGRVTSEYQKVLDSISE